MYLFVLRTLAGKCTEILNTRRTIVRLIKPFVLQHFHGRCGLYKVPAFVVYKKSNYDVDISVSCLRFTPRNHSKSPACRFSHWKTLYHSPMKISGNSHRKFSLIEWKAPLVLVNFGKCSSIRQCEFSEIQTRIFHRTESAIDFSLHDACFLNCFSITI